MNPNLSSIPNYMQRQLESFQQSNPEVVFAAESIFQAFHNLLFSDISVDRNDDKMFAVTTMAFGALSSWSEAYILAASGHVASSLADIRRAIEFACYAKKTVESKGNRRALDWLSQANNTDALKRFAQSSSIPLCYESDKYADVHDLIVYYDFANYHGAHGNIQALIKQVKVDESLHFRYESPIEETWPFVLNTIWTGYRILRVFYSILHPIIVEAKVAEATIELARKEMRKIRLADLESNYHGDVPPQLYRNVCLEENDWVTKEFKRIIGEAKQRKSRQQTTAQSELPGQ